MDRSANPIVLIRLEKAAADNGFDLPLPAEDSWLVFLSTQCPLKIWLRVFDDSVFCAAFSQQNVLDGLSDKGATLSYPPPGDSIGGRTVTDIPSLHHMLRRAYQLSKALPNELLNKFEKQTQGLPKTTEVERLVIQRVGQDIFRMGLLEYWDGRCAVTGLNIPELLVASHIKPWAACTENSERLDVFNGLLLAPHLDALFDRGFITFDNSGSMVLSKALTEDARRALHLIQPQSILQLSHKHLPYLTWHQSKIFKGGALI